jgi:hypothetical protein
VAGCFIKAASFGRSPLGLGVFGEGGWERRRLRCDKANGENTAYSANGPFKDGAAVRQTHSDGSVEQLEILKGLAEGVKGREHVVVKDAGHLPLMHRAEEFERIELDFLAR